MNGLHDVGGMHGFGAIRAVADEPAFRGESERRIFGVLMALFEAGWCDADGFRQEVERLPPQRLLREVFHENHLAAVEAQLQERGLLRPGELDRRAAGGAAGPAALAPPQAPPLLPDRAEPPLPARFRAGDAVSARCMHPTGHTRLPRYLRGRRGVVEADRGVFAFADALAARSGRRPQHLYSVRFAARELWGPQAPPRDALFIDLWDDYLDAAGASPVP